LSDHITNIGERAFCLCGRLKEINIPNQVTTIPVEAFNGCTYLPSITIPNGVTKIEDGAFANCSSLQKIVIGEGITHIGSSQDGIGVFKATGLREVVLPTLKTWCNIEFQKPADNPLYHIGAFPLEETNELVLSGEIEYVKPYTFAGCKNIHSVNISKNIRSIEENSFCECDNIKLVQYSGSGYNWNRYIKDSTLTDSSV
jgi:hypothetical protein